MRGGRLSVGPNKLDEDRVAFPRGVWVGEKSSLGRSYKIERGWDVMERARTQQNNRRRNLTYSLAAASLLPLRLWPEFRGLLSFLLLEHPHQTSIFFSHCYSLTLNEALLVILLSWLRMPGDEEAELCSHYYYKQVLPAVVAVVPEVVWEL